MKLGLRLAAVVSVTSALWLSAGCAQEQPGAKPAGEKKVETKKEEAKPADAGKKP